MVVTARVRTRSTGVATIVLALCACTTRSIGGAPSLAELPNVPMVRRYPKIQHVVIVVQENRTVDNLFQGFPGADTKPYGFDHYGHKVMLKPVSLNTLWDFEHDSTSFLTACDGRGAFPGTDCRMDGFDKEYWRCGKPGYPRCPNADPPYSYVPRRQTTSYFFIGMNYVFADEMFPSNFDSSSFVSHQYIIAGQASSTVNFPVGPWGCEGGSTITTVTAQRTIGGNVAPCFNNTTLGDELDKAGISWRYYATPVTGSGGTWSAYQAIEHIYDGPDWSKSVVTPPTRFYSDVASGALPAVSWVTPTCRNSDHPYCGSDTGPAWVASLVNTIGESKYWDSTVMFIFWDDYGGWYDHVPPAFVDYDGLGIRVPLMIVSAYAKKGYVSHVHYEHGSILKFVEDQWGLPRLSASDARANPISRECFDFSRRPRPFTKIPAAHDQRYFLAQPLDTRPPDSQ
jgi:phospholipase C